MTLITKRLTLHEQKRDFYKELLKYKKKDVEAKREELYQKRMTAGLLESH